METLISKYMVESQDDSRRYIPMSRAGMARIASPLYLEGVDGDEEGNAVTYWYVRTDPRD